MSLMRTLAKVAMGVAVAKGVKAMTSPGSRNVGEPPRGAQDAFGGLTRGLSGGTGGGLGGLGSMLEGLVGGGQRTGAAGTGAPYGGQHSTGAQTGARQSGGGLDGLLGGLLGGGAAAGGLGGMLGQLAGRAQASPAAGRHSFGEVLDSAGQANSDKEALDASPEQEAAAGLMLRAMIQAAKADGRIDAEERRKLMDRLGDLDAEERAFVEAELEAPVDPEGLARQTPKGLETAVYAMSAMAIEVDTQAEADHLNRLSAALGLGREDQQRIHRQLS